MKSSRCAACKDMRKKCPSDCVFSPYFPRDDPMRYDCVHQVYGASNFARMIKDLPVEVRGEAAEAMYLEARYRVEDPIYGCVKIISQLQHEIHVAANELARVRAEIAILAAWYSRGNELDGLVVRDYC